MKYVIIGVFFLSFSQTGCYYDDKALLFPQAPCDTTSVTYSRSVNPILTANCVGCHVGTNAPSGVKLDTYAGVKAIAQNPGSLLVGVITHSAGFAQMPKNGNKLDSCSIHKITEWVNAGAPNN